jgi:hypothetical protein
VADRVTQVAQEALQQGGGPDARLTQSALEALQEGGVPHARFTQVAVEVLVQSSNPRVTQVALETLVRLPAPPVPPGRPAQSPGDAPGATVGGYGSGGYGNSAVVAAGQAPPTTYYLSLITSEYQQSTKFLAWLAAPLVRLDDAALAIVSLRPGFDLDGAIGAQLDILGQIIGPSRVVDFQPSLGVSPTLDDETYRILLRAGIAKNQWDGKIDSLQKIWKGLFPGGLITLLDAQDMSASIILSGTFTSILQDLITHGKIVPRPEGVLYNYFFSELPIFGFDQDGTFIAGFGRGHFA